jgi:hypothetical protein
MHRGFDNRWTSSQPSTAPGESGVYNPHTQTPPAPPNPAGSALRTFVLALAILLVLNAAANAALNPSGEFRAGGMLIESVLASESHQKVVALDEFIAERAGAPMGVVLGSSRVMELAFGDSASPLPFYNCGVSGARAEDILAFTRFIFDHSEVHLAEAVIGVDPFALALPGEVVYGARLRGVYPLERLMRDRIPFGERLGWRAAALLGRDWTTALREVGDPPPKQWFEPNGMYPESNYVMRVGTSDSSRARYLANHIEMVTTNVPASGDPDPRRVEDITEALRLLRAHGTRVTVFLPPTHPRLLAALRGNAVFRSQLEHDRETLKDVAGRTGAAFVDLTEPAASGLTPDDFWDGYHYRAEAAVRVVRAIRAASTPEGSGGGSGAASLTAR